MALTDLTRISTSGIATGTSLSGAILHGDAHFRGTQVGVTSALFDSSDDALEFNDNVKLKFGNSGDMMIYHDGSHSHIFDNGTGDLRLTTGGQKIDFQKTGGEVIARFYTDGANELYYDGTKRFNTTSTGAVVTGILTASSFSGPIGNPSGISTFYDLRVINNLTVEGTTTTLDTNLIGVDRIEVGANSNSIVGVAVTQSGTADIVNLFDGSTEIVEVASSTNAVKITHTGGYGLQVKRGSKFLDLNGDWATSGNAALNAGDSGIRFYYGASSDGIQFNTGTGTDKVRITSAGKVGINTTVPLGKLHIKNGDSGASTVGSSTDELVLENNTNTGMTILSATNGEGGICFGDSGDHNIGKLVYSHADNSMQFKTNDNERLRITSGGDIQVDNGNVHIDDNGEFAIFEQNTSLAMTNSSKISMDFNSNVARIRSSHNGSGGNAVSRPLAFFIGSSEKLRIDSNGRLIIGHTGTYAVAGHYPALQLSGTTYNGATIGIINNANDATGAYIQLSKQRSGSPAGATIVQDDDLVGQITFTAADGTDLTSRIAEIKGMVDGTPGSNDTPGRLSFWTTADGAQSSSERLRITSGGDIGLGESNPNRAGYGSPVVSLGYNTTNGYSVLELLGEKTSDDTIANIVAYNVGGSSRVAAIAFERNGANNSGAIRFETYASGSSSEILRITSTKRVSIGDRTTNPDELVHIHTASGDARVHIEGASDAELKLTSHNGDSTIFMGDTSSGSIGSISYDHGGDDFIFRAGGNPRGRIYDNAGVTGIEHHQFHPFLIGYDAQTSSDITMVRRFGGMSCIPINADGDKAFMSYTTHWRHREYAGVYFWYGASGNTSGHTFDWDFTVWSATHNEGYSSGSNHTFTIATGSMSNGKMYRMNALSSWPSHHNSELVQFQIEYDEIQNGTSLQLTGMEIVEYTTP